MPADPSPKKKRAAIGRVLRHRLFDEVRSTCPNPLCKTVGISVLELHHIDGDRSFSRTENLIALCGTCHTQAEKQLISESDLAFWKRMLLNCYHPRLGPISEPESASVINVGANHGQVASRITNNYGKGKVAPIILPEAIGSDLHLYNYVDYLVIKLAAWREKGSFYGQKRSGKIHPGVIRNQIKNAWGALPKDLPLDSADGLIRELKDKIDATALGVNNLSKGIRNYHTLEEHADRMRRGKRRSSKSE